MNQVADRYEEVHRIPFAMAFMQEPEHDHCIPKNASTLTTVYTTRCGPNDSPDDGAITKKDD
jgi:hypothetical protein